MTLIEWPLGNKIELFLLAVSMVNTEIYFITQFARCSTWITLWKTHL